MRLRTPPKIATWLLTRLASGPQSTAMIGDLQEQYQRRQSAAWYWWQTIATIAIGGVHDVRDHPVIVGRAMLMWYSLTWMVGSAALFLYRSLGLFVWNWTVDHGFDMLRVFWFGRPRLGIPVLLMMACIDSGAIGWLIARFHRGHTAAVVLAGVAMITSHELLIFGARGAVFGDRVIFITAPLFHFINAPFVAPTPFFIAALAIPCCFLVGALSGSLCLEDAESAPFVTIRHENVVDPES